MDCRDLSTAQGCPAEAADAYARARELQHFPIISLYLFDSTLLFDPLRIEFAFECYPYKDGDGEGRLTLT
jgi:hypothetical protein